MKKTFKRCCKTLAEILLGLLIIFLIGIGFASWKLSQGPVDMAKAIPYIQDEFENSSQNDSIEIETLILSWDDFKDPLRLNARHVVVANDRGPYLSAPEIDIELSIPSLLIGRLKFETINVHDVTLSITKKINGQIQIKGSTPEEKNNLNTDNATAILTLNDLIYDLPRVNNLSIDNASIHYEDEVTQEKQVFDPAFLNIEMTSKRGTRNISGFIKLPLNTTGSTAPIKIDFSTQHNPAVLNISGIFKETPIDSFIQFLPQLPTGFDLNMVVNADVNAQLDNSWNLHQLDLKLDAPRGQILFPFNDKKDYIDVKNFDLHVMHDPKTDITTVEKFSTLINDTLEMQLSGALSQPQKPEDLSGNINLSLQNIPQSYFKQYWPVNYTDNGAYEWLTEKIDGGAFSSLNLTTIFDRSATSRTDDKSLPPQIISLVGDMIYSDLDIQYHPTLATAKNVSGTGTYKDGEFTLNIDEANVGGMITNDATLYFDDLINEDKGHGRFVFPVKAAAQDVFDYIKAEPIGAFKNGDFKPQNTKGDVDATITIDLPLIKDAPIEDLILEVKGTLKNTLIPNAIKGLSLTGGPYDIVSSARDITISGSGQLDDQPITLDWHEFFKSQKSDTDYVSKINATVTTNEKIRRAFIGDFTQYFEGNAVTNVNYLKNKNNRDAVINATVNLNDTIVIIPSFDFKKPANDATEASLKIQLVDDSLEKISDITVKGDKLSLDSGDLYFKTVGNDPLIVKGSLKNLRLNDNRISAEIISAGNLLKTDVSGQYLDIRPLLNHEKDKMDKASASDERAHEYHVNVDEIRAAENSTIKNAKTFINFDKKGKAQQFELSGKLGTDGMAGEIYIRYAPNATDGLSLKVDSDNAGETLRAFDLYQYIQGGQLQIAGRPVEGGRFGDVSGKARINNFSVSNSPVFLRLINALSFQNFLQANTLSFSRLESDFEWKLGDTGDVYIISNGTTSGASVALTFDGFVNTANDKIKITGNAAPLSQLNGFIGKIPLLGQILTGGDALLAATYSITGNPSSPSVNVNPLSMLAPGIIRKMLFETTPVPDSDFREPADNANDKKFN